MDRLELPGAMRFEFSIRPEASSDAMPIAAITRVAFADHPFSSHTEHLIVDALRAADALTLSLVAVQAQRVIGHIAFSPVTITDGAAQWFGLGPLSVAPQHQRNGVGKALVQAGLQALRNRDANGCVLLGEPAFYARFGFQSVPGLLLPDVPPEYFLALALRGPFPAGVVHYHESFNVTADVAG